MGDGKLLKNMKYDELIETLNKDTKALEHLSGKKGAQLQIFKDEKTVAADIEQK